MTTRGTSGNASDRRKFTRAKVRKNADLVLNDKECGNGLFWCNHVYDEAYPWCWVDFKFLSLKNPKKYYFAVAMTTLEYSESCADDDKAYEMTNAEIGLMPESEWVFDRTDPHYGKLYRNAADEVATRNHIDHQRMISSRLNCEPRYNRPTIDIKVASYRPGTIGIWCTVDKPHIDAQVIAEFIEHFRMIGEPNEEGIAWAGEEVEIIPQKLTERYSRNA